MTPNAKAFKDANQKSPVVAGGVIGNGGEGAHYRLANGREFTLSLDECVAVGLPRWRGVNPS